MQIVQYNIFDIKIIIVTPLALAIFTHANSILLQAHATLYLKTFSQPENKTNEKCCCRAGINTPDRNYQNGN